MEVAGADVFRERVIERLEAVGLDADDAVELLEAAFDDEEGARQDGPAVRLVGGRVDDDVGGARLVLEREGDAALGCGGAPAYDPDDARTNTAAAAPILSLPIT